MATDFDLRLVPYSGKFSWVQNFADMPSDPSEEIFVVFIFVGYTGTPVVQTTPLSLHVLYVVHYVAIRDCLLYTSPSPRDATLSRMPSSA